MIWLNAQRLRQSRPLYAASVLVLLMLVAYISIAAQEALNNDAVVRLVKAGLSEDLIVSTISAKPGTYDTSADGMAALKAAGASDKVIAAVLAKSSSPTSGESSTRPENHLKSYTLEYAHSDRKWWHGPGTASDKYDEISEDIRNGLIEALDKKGLRLAASPDTHPCRLTFDLQTVKSRASGHGFSALSLSVEVAIDLKLEDANGHPIFGKGFLGKGEGHLPATSVQIKEQAVLQLADAIASDEGFIKAINGAVRAR